MEALLTLLFLLPLTWTIAVVVAEREDCSLLVWGVTAAWAVLGSLLVLVNEWMPFTGGDDNGYFALAETTFGSLSDAFDLTRFIGVMEQPGYPLLLSILNHFVGHDLLSFKLFNLFSFIVLAIIWYRIGTLLESPTFGRYVFAGVLCLTPLWFYFFMLLKDMSIAMLQSMFLLGVVKVCGRSDLKASILIVSATLGVLLFRTHLALQHVWIVLGVAMLMVFASGKIKVWFLVLIFLLTGAVLAIGTSPERMAALGIYNKQRVLGDEGMFEVAAASRQEPGFNALIFPLLYLFTETQAFNPQTWSELDAFLLRGLLAIPWIALGVPFALLGISKLWRARLAFDRRRRWLLRLRSSKLLASPWAAVVLFILSYLGVSWSSGDTTRWRIADMPALATIALAGWWMSPPSFSGPVARAVGRGGRRYILILCTGKKLEMSKIGGQHSVRAPESVLMITPQFRPIIGGYERAAERLCAALAERGFQVTVITERRVRSWPIREIVQGYEVRRLPCLYRRRLHVISSLLVFGIYMLLNGWRFQVWHVHQYGPQAALAVALGKLLRRPVVLKLPSSGAMGIEKALGRGLRGGLLGFLHRRVSACLVISKETRAEAIQFGIPPERVHLIPDGVDCRSFRPASPKERAEARRTLGLECQRLVLYVGRLAPEKNPLGLLEAWTGVDKAVREGSLLALVGDGPLRVTLADYVAAKGCSESVQIVGERNDVACWMRAADLYVLPSHIEGLSIALLEAMASGLPVISTRVSGSIETVEEAGAGLLVDVGRVDQLSEAMARMLADTPLREHMGQAGCALIEAKYPIDVWAQACLRLYRILRRVPAVDRSDV